MFCKKAILVNWGNIPPLEFDFGPVNLFSGGNGSGKTTAADALQSLMTAAHENLFNYNPGQDETTQRGRGGKQVRTLASYILGCDDGSYARVRSCQGYVAALFHPTQGESGEAFWAVMAVQASLDSAGKQRQARQDELQFFILPGDKVAVNAIGLGHFVKQDSGGKHIVTIADFSRLLKQEFGRESIEIYDKKSAYLRRLYGAFRGLNGAVSDREAKHAAKTFSNFMAYKPVKSINDFVAREVLEPRDLSEDIRQVSELMKTIHGMEQETRLLNDSISTLEAAQHQGQLFVHNWQQLRQGEYAEIFRRSQQQQRDYLLSKEQQEQNQQAIEECQHQAEILDTKKVELLDQISELKAQRLGISALKDKDQLSSQRDSAQVQLGEQAAELLRQQDTASRNFDLAKTLANQIQQSSLSLAIPALGAKPLQQALKQLQQAGDDHGIDAQQLMTKDFIGSSNLESKLSQLNQRDSSHQRLYQLLRQQDNGQRSLRDQLLSLSTERQQQQQKNHKQIDTQQLDIQRLENQNISYPPHVVQALAEIERHCPAAKPVVLCDFIEVIDSRWQMAIEGYLGGARFGIIVEADYEAEAIRIVRGIKGRRSNARVIQGSKAARDAGRSSLARNSIVELMEFEHKTAEYYLRASYGSVVRVDNEEELRHTSRGLCANGLGSGNYSLFRCDVDDADLVFGQGARDRALAAKQQQLQQLLAQSEQLEVEHRQIARCFDAANGFVEPTTAELVKQLLSLYRLLEKIEQQLSELDLSEHQDLEARLIQLNDDYQQAEQQLKQQVEQKGKCLEKSQSLGRSIAKTADELEVIQTQLDLGEDSLREIAKLNPEYDPDAALSQAEQQGQQAHGSLIEQNKNIAQNLDKHERSLAQHILQHNQQCNSHSSIAYLLPSEDRQSFDFYQAIINTDKQLEAIYHSLKNNVLIGKHEKLLGLKDSFNTAFVTNLCHSIYQAINEGKRILEDLNQELQHHRFGDDRERFYFDFDWVPEFREYHRFFKDVIEIPNLGDGNSLFEADLSDKSRQVRDKLLAMLLDKDEQTALRELKRISDYRNYRRYEIYKEPLNKQAIALSTYGTGSGGQLETPAYIIRAAAVTSAFRFNEGSSHCRMVLVDEAFSKMDETRSRQVIHYLTESLGLQLIFIMPTSKSGPFMDLISHQVIFSKCPATKNIGELETRVLVDRKICNSDKIQQLWAKHRKTVRHQAMLDFMEDFIEAEN